MEEGPDFISSLPQDILLLIASMIPLKEAMRTAILSDSWRRLWAPSKVKLELYSTQTAGQEAREKIQQIIGAFSKYYDYPGKLKLCLEYADYTEKRADYPNIMEESLAVVTKGTQGELHFDFSAGEELTKSSTEFNLNLEAAGDLSCPTFSSLKILQLRSVSHVAENMVTDLFSSCQFLESLRLEKCRELQNIDIKANNCLKSLTIVDCVNVISLKLSAPRLKAFSYKGILPNIQLKDTQHVTDALLDCRDGLGHNDFDCEDVLCLLSSLKDVEILTISGWLLEWLCTAGVIFGRLEYKFNKLKEFWWIDPVMDTRKRDSLACFLNMTPTLERLFVKIEPKCRRIPSPFLPHEYWHEPHLWMDYADVKCNASPLKHLKTIELVGFRSKEDEVLLMDLLLHQAVNLKDMIVISPENVKWRLTVTPRSQLSYVVRRNQSHKLVPSPNGYSLYILTPVKH